MQNARSDTEWMQYALALADRAEREDGEVPVGAVVVGPHASELIHVLTLAIQQRLTADEVAATFTVYPSLSGSIAEAARRLHIIEE
jgi:dihydrolipoamide dehydrogenase